MIIKIYQTIKMWIMWPIAMKYRKKYYDTHNLPGFGNCPKDIKIRKNYNKSITMGGTTDNEDNNVEMVGALFIYLIVIILLLFWFFTV